MSLLFITGAPKAQEGEGSGRYNISIVGVGGGGGDRRCMSMECVWNVINGRYRGLIIKEGGDVSVMITIYVSVMIIICVITIGKILVFFSK